MSGYTKLFSSIVGSTIWQECLATKVVWITMLAMSDRDGNVEGSIPGLAHLAGVTIPECEQALATLREPDRYSRTPDHDGRRIEPIDGGWLILNRAKYRDLIPDEQRRERDRDRQRRHRLSRVSRVTECDSHDSSHQTETEKEKEINTTPLTPQGGKRKRRSRTEIISGYTDLTRQVVNEVLSIWPHERPGNKSAITPDVALLASRVDELLSKPGLSPALLLGGAKKYLAEEKQYPHAPEFFFGPGKNGEPPWRPYCRLCYHEEHQKTAGVQ